MTEAERVTLYNNLCDFREELQNVYPLPTKKINTLSQAIIYVRGTTATWQPTAESQPIIINGRAVGSTCCTCSACRFPYGRSDFRLCPNCGAKMKRVV